MTNSTRKLLRLMPVAAMFFLAGSGARAEDIDIYAGPTTNDLPNVIIIWDSSANWETTLDLPIPCSYSDGSGGPDPKTEQGKKMAIEKCAIYNVIDALPTGPGGTALFNVALMLFNTNVQVGQKGGYPRKQFLPMNTAGKAALKFVIRNIDEKADKANNAPFAKSLYEAYLMFAKAVPYVGTAGTTWDPAAVANGHYVGPAGTGCGKNHIIFIANGSAQETNGEALALLAGLPPPSNNTAKINYPTSYITNSDQADWADEFARDLRTVDVSSKLGVQSITTHAIAVTGASSDGLYPNFIKAIATEGGGQYFAASDVNLLIKYLTDIFNSIQAVNSVFSAASLPISASVQGTFKSQVFIGLFRPDALARPRWFGNLKQYQVVYDPVTNTVQLGDSLGNGALNAGSGFFDPAAVSFWTTASSFWINDPKGTPPSASDLPDGEVAEKGGVAEVLRTNFATDQSARKVYTCIGCAAGTTFSASPGSATSFVDANNAITQAMLGAANATERTNLINWIRGLDNNNDELGPGAPTTVRPSIHGDVLHSRAVVVDYGPGTGTITYYGDNEGMLHAIDGNQTGSTAGQELWAFIPQEFFGSSVNQTCNNNTNTTYRFKRLRDNAPQIWFNTASTDASPPQPCLGTATRRDYGVDGSITAYQKLNNSGGVAQVLLYVSMRRGGRALYAFDVTNPTTPIYLWKKLPSDISALGQTWSEPRLTRIKASSTNPVLVFGAGYDAAAEDVIPPGATTMGNAVLVLDAITGSVLQTLATDRSVPAAVTFLDTDYDGNTDRAYAVDLGATVYRIDFEDASGNPAWAITKFAALADGSNTRKFFYEPDAVQTKNFVAVLVGTGNREHPLLSSTNDRFYTLFDYKMSKGAPASAPINETGLVPVTNNFNLSVNPPGCYLALDTAGEKVVTASVTTGGNSYFATNMPTPPDLNSCSSNLGLARTYQMPLFCGIPVTQDLAGGGLPPTPVSGTVGVQIAGAGNNPPTTKLVPFIIGGINPQLSGIGVSRVPINIDHTRRRIYWFSNTGH